jgi:hypothetical protein
MSFLYAFSGLPAVVLQHAGKASRSEYPLFWIPRLNVWRADQLKHSGMTSIVHFSRFRGLM